MLGFYFVLVFVGILIAYAGVEETMKLFAFADLQVRYAFIKIQMKWMGWRLKRRLIKDTTDFEKFLKEYDK